jgi:hypothetical protein
MTVAVFDNPANPFDVRKAFEEDGYLLVRNVLSPEEMDDIQAQWSKMRDRLRSGDVVDGIRRDNFYIHGRLEGPMGSVYRHSHVVDLAKALLGEDLAIYMNRLNVKDTAFSDSIHLHQDVPYFNGGPNKINFFLAFQDTNVNNGAMLYVPGSHKLGLLDRNTIDISAHPELPVIVPSLRAGDMVIAHGFLWHASVPNSQHVDRTLLQMIFQPASDGSFYPPSMPEPNLVAGEWRTNRFLPWVTYSERGEDGEARQPDLAMMGAVAPVAAMGPEPAPAIVPEPEPVAAQPAPGVVQLLKRQIPIGMKQRIKDLLVPPR